MAEAETDCEVDLTMDEFSVLAAIVLTWCEKMPFHRFRFKLLADMNALLERCRW